MVACAARMDRYRVRLSSAEEQRSRFVRAASSSTTNAPFRPPERAVARAPATSKRLRLSQEAPPTVAAIGRLRAKVPRVLAPATLAEEVEEVESGSASQKVAASSPMGLSLSCDMPATLANQQCHLTPLAQSLQAPPSPLKATRGFVCAAERAAVDSSRYFVSFPNFCDFDHKAEAMGRSGMEKHLAEARGASMIPLWSRQLDDKGSQSFVVAGYNAFWRRYSQQTAPEHRVFYEMIHRDSLVKCFTDYDATTASMSRDEFFANVSLLNRIISERLMSLYGVAAKLITLHSSTDKKLSVHCVWKMRGAMFVNVYHLKAFMMLCAIEAHSRFPSRTKGEAKKVFGILDMAVYKPGAYRLYGSTKLRQSRHLTHKDDHDPNTLSKGTFMASLIQHFEGTVERVLKCQVPAGEALRTDLLRSRNGGRAWLARSNINGLALPLLQRILAFAECESVCAVVCKRWHVAVTGVSLLPRVSALLLQRLLQLLTEEAKICNIEGAFKSAPLVYSGVYGRCVIFGQASRRCELSWQVNNRDHLGNSIYWVMFPDLGVFYQKCHDAECKLRVSTREQPSLLPNVTLSIVEGEEGTRGCLLRNSALQVECLIALEGRGIVRPIPDNVLFCHQMENASQGRSDAAVEIRRIAENSLTVVRVSDLVCFENEERVYVVRSVSSRGQSARLEAFEAKGEDGAVVECDRRTVQMLRLVGALIRVPTQLVSSSAPLDLE